LAEKHIIAFWCNYGVMETHVFKVDTVFLQFTCVGRTSCAWLIFLFGCATLARVGHDFVRERGKHARGRHEADEVRSLAQIPARAHDPEEMRAQRPASVTDDDPEPVVGQRRTSPQFYGSGYIECLPTGFPNVNLKFVEKFCTSVGQYKEDTHGTISMNHASISWQSLENLQLSPLDDILGIKFCFEL
jgi:hypothetical protein